MKEIIEPFRIKMVEPIRQLDAAQRAEALERAHLNPFLLAAEDVLIDFLTDSGTSSMSAAQWGALMIGDESYAGSRSFQRFERTVRDLTGMKHIIPVHQGRAAERILMSLVAGPGKRIPSNNHFDTTRANIEVSGAIADDLVTPDAAELDTPHPFKGNLDCDRLERYLDTHGPGVVPIVMLTVTNNAGGGQPACMANIAQVARIARARGIPFFLDACRFAENAYFIKAREPGMQGKSCREIAREMFSHADGVLASLKKDGFGNIGGYLACNDDALAEAARNLLILTEGFPTYGGLAGRDLEALAVGLEETLDEDYLHYRIACSEYFARGLRQIGVRIVEPPGAHAIYIDARAFYPQIPAHQLPAQVLVNQLYLQGGVRAVELGTVMFGRRDPATGIEHSAPRELVRLAFPRRVYTQAHFNYALETIAQVHAERDRARGLEITYQAPFLRHFTARFAPIRA